MDAQQINSLPLSELNKTIALYELEQAADKGKLELISSEIEELRRKLEELQATRNQVKMGISRRANDLYELSARKEKLLADQMQEELIRATAERVWEICAEYDGWIKAHEYQKEDIITLIHAYLTGYTGFLNANDLGLGKTMETFVSMYIIAQMMEAEKGTKPRILWLTKSSILKTGGSLREGKRWYPELKMVSLDGSAPKQERELMFKFIKQMKDAAVITNYESVRTTENLHSIKWDIIVMDEVHKLKGGANLSGPTGIWKAVKELVHSTGAFTIMLSGTPMQNRPAEMWAYLHIFDPNRFPTVREFENLFCVMKDYQLKVDPTKLLNQALTGRMIHRTRGEVGIQLPEVTPDEDKPLMVQMSGEQLRVYNEMRDRFYVWLDDQHEAALTSTAIIAQLTRLRQINIWPVITFDVPGEFGPSQLKLDVRESSKIDELMDQIESAQDQVLVFCTFNEPLKEVQRRAIEDLGLRAKILTGENSKDLYHLETDFQQGLIDVLCINSAMGEGLNLQKNPGQWEGGSAYAFFLDLWWNSSRDLQCEGRIHRQGANVPVTIRHIKNENSVDQFIDLIREEKDSEIGSIMKGDQIRPASVWKQFLRGVI